MPTTTKSIQKRVRSLITAAAEAWYLKKASFNRFLGGSTSETTAIHLPPIPGLPQELVDIIASFLIYDTETLIACSMTSFSWYMTVVPHLHYTLTTDDEAAWDNRWPKLLKISHELRLLPLVGKLRIRKPDARFKFHPDLLYGSTLSCFSALSHLQELGIDRLLVFEFMPGIETYFGHLGHTLRFLSLRHPEGSSRQILYFVGLFPRLQDLKLCNLLSVQEEDTADSTPKPTHTPLLCGRLTLSSVKEPFVKDMIKLFDGLRFRYMELFDVQGATLLFEACAETLETLRLYPTDPHVVDFNLSKNRSLRTLETTSRLLDDAPGPFKSVFATTRPHGDLPLDVVTIHDEFETNSCWGWHLGASFTEQLRRFPLNKPERFELYREMYSVRKFRLILYADVPENTVNRETKEVLKRILRSRGWPHELLIITNTQRTIRHTGLPERPTAVWPPSLETTAL